MKKDVGNYIIFLIIILFVTFPAIQQFSDVIPVRRLKGYMPPVDTPSFGFNSWFSEDFQESTEKFLKREVGFHAAFVRVNNQLLFSLFDKVPASSMIEGKEGHRFAPQYIESYLGKDFIGSPKIKDKVRRLTIITDTLEKKGTFLVVVFVPGKGFFHPEYFPDQYWGMQKDSTNYEVYKQYIGGTNINLLDMSSYFLSMKDTSKYVLYPKNAIHLSLYGNHYIGDSLLSYIEYKKKQKLPRFKIIDTEVTDKPRGADRDVEDAMNLIFDLREEGMAYPVMKLDTLQTKPLFNVLSVGDSFYFGFLSLGYYRAFDHQNFWFYFNEVYPPMPNGTFLNAKDLSLKEEIESRDVIILYVNDAKLKDFAWGFIDEVYDLYVKE